METTYKIDYSEPMLFLAIHAGHGLSENIRNKIGLPELDRMREEDPFTDFFIVEKKNHIIQHTSRFEYDLNRNRDKAVYRLPEDCWGLPIYPSSPLTADEINASLEKYDLFYQKLVSIIDQFLERYEKIIVWDIHSYNHRRGGVNADFDSASENPEIIIGTNNYRYMPDLWKPTVDKIENFFRSHEFTGQFINRSLSNNHLDVRQNIKFPGGYLSQLLNYKYTDRVCCIAIEFKKIWMNEWTQEIDEVCRCKLKEIFDRTCEKI